MTERYEKNESAIARLTPRQYAVTQEGATEPAFDNEYWDTKEAGIYVDIVSGEPLFASLQKFDSGCGWPSFTIPLERENVIEKLDPSHGMVRTEVRSAHGDSHLGHVFDDGPPESGGLRYCIDSAALRFIPYDELETEGYGQYKRYFEGEGLVEVFSNRSKEGAMSATEIHEKGPFIDFKNLPAPTAGILVTHFITVREHCAVPRRSIPRSSEAR